MIPSEKPHLKFSAQSHPGSKGRNNEDRYLVRAYQVGEHNPLRSVFSIVADGVGEHHAGEVAAQIAVETITRAVGQSHADQPNAILQAAIIQAGQAILAQSETDNRKRGLGSTCLCAWVVGDRLYTASVGNSRLYLLREGRLRQLNIIQHLLRDTELEGNERERVEEVRGYLGSRLRVQVDQRLVLRTGGERNAERNQGLRLRTNDRLLLCTDGLSDALNGEEIAARLASTKIEGAAQSLIDTALDKGAPDNLTAVVLGVPPARPHIARRRRNWRRMLVTGLAALLLVLLSMLGWFFLGEDLNPNRTPQPTAISTLTPVATNTPQLP